MIYNMQKIDNQIPAPELSQLLHLFHYNYFSPLTYKNILDVFKLVVYNNCGKFNSIPSRHLMTILKELQNFTMSRGGIL
jgi:hypothetical protein